MTNTSEIRAISVADALTAARDTRELQLGSGALARVVEVFRRQFGDRPAIVVADSQTLEVAGRRVESAFAAAGRPLQGTHVFPSDGLYAEHGFVDALAGALAGHGAIPIAVGAGTINDVTKLAAHRTSRGYMVVATAASMDGYTAYGASITFLGSKQTFDCPAPRAVVADIDIIRSAPRELTASGYADLMAKVTAGADWIVADALDIEAIDPSAWGMVQVNLREALSSPESAATGKADAIERLAEALMMSGFAMQATLSSRPASGAEHQFSHLWDMQHHVHNGQAPSHGFKVGVATLAVTRLYEQLLALPLESLDVEATVARWPDWEDVAADIKRRFDIPEVRDKALEETRAKYIRPEDLRHELVRLREVWPELRERLRRQLLPATQVAGQLRAVGAAVESDEIGITPQRLRDSFRLAYYIRRRYTVLDLAMRAGVLDVCLDRIFAEPAA